MECPPALRYVMKDDCIILEKSIYSLVQVARQYNKKAVQIKKNYFSGGNVDPCLYRKKSRKGVVYLALHMDDNLLIGNLETVEKAIDLLQKNGLILKVKEDLCNSLS